MPSFPCVTKLKGDGMKVLVHLNHGRDQSYLLGFGQDMTKDKVRRILENDENKATEELLLRSTKQIEVFSKDKRKAEAAADFIVSCHGYSMERLD